MIEDLGHNFRKASGLGKIQTGNNAKDVVGYNYTVELKNARREVKKIYSINIYKVGETITDMTSGHAAEIIGIVEVTRRDLK